MLRERACMRMKETRRIKLLFSSLAKPFDPSFGAVYIKRKM